jgi:hypothetical protein
MKKTTLPKVFVKTCKKCGKEIIGTVESQVEYNFKLHVESHKNKEVKK